MNGPSPSRLVFLSDLARMRVGDKARFLGCVDSYDARTATLTLKHARSRTAAPVVVARVDIDHVLETVRWDDLDVGAWLNVIGYVRSPPEACRSSVPWKVARAATTSAYQDVVVRVNVQAVVLWAAGNVKLDEYEKAVDARKKADEEIAALSW